MDRKADELLMGLGKNGLPGEGNPSSENLTVVMVGALPVDLTQVKGGVEAVILNLFEGFKTIPSLKVVHVVFTKEISDYQVVALTENILIHFIPFRVKYEMMDYAINDELFRQIIDAEKPEIIHVQEITPQIIRLLRYPKHNIVVTQHGIMREELKYAAGLSQKLKCAFKAAVEKYLFPVFKHVIFISNYNKVLYPKKDVHGKQIFNPVNPIFFQKQSSEQEEKNTLVYVGVLSRRKNIRIVIEALNELKKEGKIFKLHVIGGFRDNGYEAEVMGLVNEFDLKDQIVFHGWKKQNEIRKIYRECPMFILPSQQETLPVSIGEAMAQGKVVIASDVGAVKEMFSDGYSGFLFRKNDRDDLARVLRTVYDNPSLKEIGARAQAEAQEKFHPALVAEKTVHFYREVIAQNKENS